MTTRTRVIAVSLTALTLTAVGAAPVRGQWTAEPRRRLPVGPPTPATAPVPVPPLAPIPVSPPAPAPTVDPQVQLTETVGMLSGLYLYQTYLTIGLLADGKAERVYDERTARAVLVSVLTPLNAVDKKMEALTAVVQTAADKEALARLRTTVALLRRQGGELAVFWNTGRPEDGARYEATRQEAWKWVVAVVGLDKRD
jgi:hypothetical protein